MQLAGKARRVRIYVHEGEKVGWKPAHLALLEFLRQHNAQGATVLRGVEGFGATSRIHEGHGTRMSSDLPVVVQVIDSDFKIAALTEVFRVMVGDGLVTVEDITVVQYRGGVTGGPAAGR